MKEVMIYGKLRRDVLKGVTPNHKVISVNSKNRYNILTVVTIKGGCIKPVEFVILEECTDVCIFLQFVRIILE